MARAMYDWPRLEREYIEGDETLCEFALRIRISEPTCFRQSAKRGWDSKRAAYRTALIMREAGGRGALVADIVRLRQRILADLLRRVDMRS